MVKKQRTRERHTDRRPKTERKEKVDKARPGSPTEMQVEGVAGRVSDTVRKRELKGQDRQQGTRNSSTSQLADLPPGACYDPQTPAHPARKKERLVKGLPPLARDPSPGILQGGG